MAMGMDIALTFLTTFIGTIKYWIVLRLEVWRTFDGHGSANKIIGCINLCSLEAKGLQHVPVKVEILLWFETKALQTLFAKRINIEYKPDFKSGQGCIIQFLDFLGDESFLTQGLMVDERRSSKRC